MKKKTCDDCGSRMDQHILGRANGQVAWFCPEDEAA